MALKNKTKASLASDLRSKSLDELKEELAKQEQEVFTLRFRHATAQLEKTSELKSAKRQVARIKTVMREKE